MMRGSCGGCKGGAGEGFGQSGRLAMRGDSFLARSRSKEVEVGHSVNTTNEEPTSLCSKYRSPFIAKKRSWKILRRIPAAHADVDICLS